MKGALRLLIACLAISFFGDVSKIGQNVFRVSLDKSLADLGHSSLLLPGGECAVPIAPAFGGLVSLGARLAAKQAAKKAAKEHIKEAAVAGGAMAVKADSKDSKSDETELRGSEHTKGKRQSTSDKHATGQARKKKEQQRANNKKQSGGKDGSKKSKKADKERRRQEAIQKQREASSKRRSYSRRRQPQTRYTQRSSSSRRRSRRSRWWR